MKLSHVNRLSLVLKWIVAAVFVLSILAVIAAPYIVELSYGTGISSVVRGLAVMRGFSIRHIPGAYVAVYGGSLHMAVLAGFLQFAGVCSAVILWQAMGVLRNVSAHRPFHPQNAVYLFRAGIACLVIALAALVRTIWGLVVYSTGMLFTYNTLFIPVFFLAALLCFVMSALFAEASALKAENDLVI